MNPQTFKWLMKREYWEHRVGLFWAPVIVASIWVFFMLLAVVIAEIVSGKVGRHGVQIDGMVLSKLQGDMSDEDRAQLGGGLDMFAAMWAAVPIGVASFVSFFYCLGALFDDRRDRSILFWKSLPISDRDTVLSKVATATITIPAIATAVGIVSGFASLVMLSILVAVHGANPFTTIWMSASPFSLFAKHLANFPIFVLWSLPTVGWLLLVSAWARSMPFIWAVFTPIFAGIVVSMSGWMSDLGSSSGWFWRHIVGRLLTGTSPYMDMAYRAANGSLARTEVHGPRDIVAQLSPSITWSSLAMPELWIGAIVGAAMIYAAIHLRTKRELAD